MKYCVFCGEKPDKKTKEHIIPQWLIKMTDYENRMPIFHKDGNEKLSFPWNKYVFPACKTCNEEFSKLESDVKEVITRILDNGLIYQSDISILLDWFDKIRIGIWLGQSLLKKEKLQPNYYIKQRLRISDRLLVINKISDNNKGICFTGTESLAYIFMPTCFGLTINNLNFINISSSFLLSKNMGFPYPENIIPHLNGQIEISKLNIGTNTISKPLLKGNFMHPSIKIYQSVLKSNHGQLYDSPSSYIQKNSIVCDTNHLVSKPYVIDDISGLNKYMEPKESVNLNFTSTYDRDQVLLNSAQSVFMHQKEEIINAINMIENASEENRESMRQIYLTILEENSKYINTLATIL